MSTVFSGARNAYDYAYGVNPRVPPLQVISGSTASGTYSLVLAFGSVTSADGQVITPSASQFTPITVGADSNVETVTPSAVSNPTPQSYGTCTITAAFSDAHSTGDQVRSGSNGLVEAMNAAHGAGGGLVVLDSKFLQQYASHAAMVTAITALPGWTNVTVLDWTGTTGAVSYAASSNGGDLTATAHVLY